MASAILGSDTNPGGRTYNEDRVEVVHFATRAGRALSLAVLADGVGGEARGERASQLAIDTFLAAMRQSDGEDIVTMLVTAIKQANLAVFAEARNLGQEGRMATTMVVAVADADNTLHIANAGDSRIYLCRDGKLVQLTRDHSFENVMVWMGKLTPEAAAVHPEAGKVMRVLGIREDLQVDVGMYQTTTEYAPANHIGREGLLLKQGDSVLLCSDGLIKPTPATHTTLITFDDVARILHSQEGDKAAHAIMSRVLGRIPVGEQVDNISVAVLQVPDPSRSVNLAEVHRAEALATQRAERRKMVLTGLTVGLPLLLALVISLAAFGAYFGIVRSGAAATGTAIAQVLNAARTQSVTRTLAPPTDTSTPVSPTETSTPVPPSATADPTQAPTSASGAVAEVFSGQTSLGPIADGSRQLIGVPTGESRYVAVTYLRNRLGSDSVTTDGHVYLGGGSRVQMGLVNEQQFQLAVLPGSDVFAQTGPYARGVELDVADSQLAVVAKGCLALHFVGANSLTVNCYGGQCAYSTRLGTDLTPVEVGSQVTLQVGQAAGSGPAPIAFADDVRFWQLLAAGGPGADDAKLCQLPDVPATQAARQQTATAFAAAAPTATPSPTAASLPSASGTP
jgi:serine/threonine protein phosphatase PrpC